MYVLDDPDVIAQIREIVRTTQPTLHVERAHPAAEIPSYHTDGAAGLDLAMLGWYVDGETESIEREFSLPPGCSIKIRTGIKVAIPAGYVGQLSGRSGLGVNKGLESRVGIIDADYRGESASC
jgi:dUTP pyrophosphatase